MSRRKLRLVRQSESGECGLACLTMIAGYYGYHTDLVTVRQHFALSARGARLSDIVTIASKMGLESKAVKMNAASLPLLQTPAMLLWKQRHFVVLKSASAAGATVLDPALGQRYYKADELAESFSAIAVEMRPSAGFHPHTDITPMSLGHLLGRKRRFVTPILKGVGLSVVIQILILVAPLFMQLAVDRNGHFNGLSLGWVAVGFALLTGLRAASVWARSMLTRRASNEVGSQITERLFHRLIRLPVTWFQRRHVGDVVSRFQSAKPVSDLLADKMVVGLSDILGVGFSTAMLFIYSARLAAIVLAGILAIVGLRALFHARLKYQEELSIAAGAREQSIFLETARAIQTIKAASNEMVRVRRWHEKHDDRVREESKVRELNAMIANLSDLLRGLVFIFVVYYGIEMVRRHQLTLGMFYAVLSYRLLLEDRLKTLLDLSFDWLSVKIHINRVGEVALAPVEPRARTEDMTAPVPAIAGALALREVDYGYSAMEPLILQNITLDIASGEFVAITGESGCGKTTLLKLLAGLVAASAGEMRLDGNILDAAKLHSYRRQIGVVLQDDMLLAGSVLENISMFETDPDIALVEDCCRLAAIHRDILALPLRYETLAGDMGSTFSGGQRQRLFLARALYRRPRILFLDEGTSALDLATEKTINAALTGLLMTRVVVAHRPETIKAANRIIRLDQHIAGDAGCRSTRVSAHLIPNVTAMAR